MKKRLIAIGGGEIRTKTTLEIDRYVARLAKEHAGDRRAIATFIGTASHDSMPYFNSFRKTYTSVFDIKAEVALSVYGEMNLERIVSKIEMSDCLYIGGGDTKFLFDHLREKGILPHIISAYNRGVIIAGLSAGAICFFDTMYSDYDYENSNEYKIVEGLGIIRGVICPHYNHRISEFDPIFMERGYEEAYAIEDNAAIEFVDGIATGAISSGGQAYKLIRNKETNTLEKISLLELLDLGKN